jgi:flagellar biosynthesis protein FlhF
MEDQIHTYRAETMQEALAHVRRELGPKAYILHTRQLTVGGRFPWQKSRVETEIVATSDAATANAVLAQQTASAAATISTLPAIEEESVPVAKSNRSALLAKSSDDDVTVEFSSAVMDSLSAKEPSKTKVAKPAKTDLAKALTKLNHPTTSEIKPRLTLPAHAQSHVVKPKHTAPQVVKSNVIEQPKTTSSPVPKEVVTPLVNRLHAQAFESATIPTLKTESVKTEPAKTAVPVATTNSPVARLNVSSAELEHRLKSLENMITHLTRQLKDQDWADVPVEWAPVYSRLIDAEFDTRTARSLVHELRQLPQARQWDTDTKKQNAMHGLLEIKLKCRQGLTLNPNRRTIAMLVGSTGVGKTTTLAKLAANFRLRDGLKIGLITIDTYRIAAVEQLRTYSEIINLPMRVASNPFEMQQALIDFRQYELVLIDTAGRSPHDDQKIHDLCEILGDTPIDETFLVLSAVSSQQSMEQTLTKFTPLGITSLIMTKLDEHVSHGMVYNVLSKSNIPVSYVTSGQDVPHDIEPAESASLAQWVFPVRT